jgi:hypothetical protein
MSTVKLDEHDPDWVKVGAGWFSSAFECAFGSDRAEVLQRFRDDLDAALVAYENRDAGAVGPDELADLVSSIKMRMGVAAEWAARIDELHELHERRRAAEAR